MYPNLKHALNLLANREVTDEELEFTVKSLNIDLQEFPIPTTGLISINSIKMNNELKWNWNFKTKNSEIVCYSNQGHETAELALKGVKSAIKNMPNAEIKFYNADEELPHLQRLLE